MTLINRLPGARLLLHVGIAALVGALSLLAWVCWKDDLFPGGPGSDSEERRRDHLEQKCRALSRRLKRKHRLAQAVLARQVTLLEAAAYFRALNHQRPDFHWDQFRAVTPGDSDDERHCHEVIHWVHLAIADTDPCLAEAERANLSSELSDHLRRGPLRLSEISELPAFLDDCKSR
jgi:hypothetical protein